MLRTIPARTKSVVLTCSKCSKKLGGGFGKKGKKSLAESLRDLGDGKKGIKSKLLVVETGCLKVCPKGAVVAIDPAKPGEWLLVPAGADVATVAGKFGITPSGGSPRPKSRTADGSAPPKSSAAATGQ